MTQIIAVTESHLKEEIKDCESSINEFEIPRSDRKYKSRGGVAIFTKKEIKATKILEGSNNQCEMVGVWVMAQKLLVVCIYRPL